MATCRSCRAAVIWVVTESGAAMPVDPVPTREGNLVVNLEVEPPVAKYLSPTDVKPEGPLYLSHFVTCPDRDKWRR